MRGRFWAPLGVGFSDACYIIIYMFLLSFSSSYSLFIFVNFLDTNKIWQDLISHSNTLMEISNECGDKNSNQKVYNI